MIRHEQFMQDVTLLASMYSACADVLRERQGKHPEWIAVMMEGPMDQARELRAEMHEYLKLPEVLAVPPGDGSVARIKTLEDYLLRMEQLCRLYRALGNLRMELAQFLPNLYAVSVQQFTTPLAEIEAAVQGYLQWEEIENVLAELERKHSPVESGASLTPLPAPSSVPESHPQP
jgi:hypothetical protein